MCDSECEVPNVSIADAFHSSSTSTLWATSSVVNGDSVVTQQRVPNNPSILNGKYFSVIKEKSNDTSIVGLCQLCLPKKTEIKGQITSSSNFLSHLKRKHFTAFEAYSLEFGRKKQRVPMTHEEAMNIAQNQFETDCRKIRYSCNDSIEVGGR